MPFDGIGKLLCANCKSQMNIVVVEADKGINRYRFECSKCDYIRIVEVAPKLYSIEYDKSL